MKQPHPSKRYGLIAGNGRFPILVLEAARSLGIPVVAIGVKGEAAPEIAGLAERTHWITIGQLSRLIEILHQEKIEEVTLAGQIKHASIFSAVRPDRRLFKLLGSLKEKNTDALIGGIIGVLEQEGVRVADSTALLKPLLAAAGVLTRRKPAADERTDADYGRRIAAALSALDVGQSVVVCEKACVAVEAMEGTDALLRRAAGLVNGRRLTLVKASGRRRHLLFDVPVAGPGTIRTMRETGTTMLAVDAGRTLLLDRAEMLQLAGEAQICVVGYDVAE